ncbi:hypothetical protein Tco_1317443 [Tanacetum coccineum]
MSTIDGMKSILTQSALDALCEKFHIPDTVHPELPGHNDRIRNSPTGKIDVYTSFFDFANYRIPLSQFLVDILEHFHINLSQLSVIANAKVSHFEILCRVYGFVPTVGNFRRFYINSKDKGWMSFSKRSDTGPICYTKPLDSLKHWNDHFFWVDASVFPFPVPWHNNKTLRKDPHPLPTEFNADVCHYLATNPASFKKFLEPFLCFISISRYYKLDVNCYPAFLTDDDKEMDLFAFIHYADPTKGVGDDDVNEESGDAAVVDQVRESDHAVQDEGANIVHIEDKVSASVAERAKGSRKKRKTIGGASGSNIPPKKLRADHGTSGVGASTGRKSVVAHQGLLERSTLPVEVGVTAVATLPFITSSASFTSEREGGGRRDSVTGPHLRTQHPTERFIILSDSPCHSSSNAADAEVSSVVISLVPEPPIMTAAIATTVVADTSSIPMPRAGEEPVHASIFADSTSAGTVGPDIAGPSQPAGMEFSADTFYVSHDIDSEMLHQIYVPRWNMLRSMDYEQWFAEFNVGVARQTCLSAEVRMRFKHELRGRKKFEGKCAMQANLLKERDADVASLKAQLSLKEAEVAGAIRLDDTELASSNAQIAKLTRDLSNFQLSCDELSIQAASLESEKDKLTDQLSMLETTCLELRDEVSGYKLFKEQIEAAQDKQVKMLSDRVAELDFELMGMALHLDEEFYPRYLTTIAVQRWILGTIGRAIDKGMQDGLAAALRVVDFPLLAQLKSHKDASIADIMGLLHFEGPAVETPDASQLQPPPEQLMLPIHQLEDQVLSISDVLVPLIEPLSAENLVGEASTFGVPAMITTTALPTTFVQTGSIPQVSVADYEVSGAGSSTKVPSPLKIVFEKEELETTPEHTMVD